MRHIALMAGSELEWVKPRLFSREYELRAGEGVVATLRFRSPFGSFATAESAEGCWTFERAGIWRTRVTIRSCETEAEVATFRQSPWSAGTLELPDGRKYLLSANFLHTRFEIRTESGEPVIHLQTRGLLGRGAEMTIAPTAAELPELPWMSMLGWYLAILIHDDSAGAAAATTAAAAG